MQFNVNAGDGKRALAAVAGQLAEAIPIPFDVDQAFAAFGLTELYEDDRQMFGDAWTAADEELFDAGATADERARHAEIATELQILLNKSGRSPAERDRTVELMEKGHRMWISAVERAIAVGHPAAARRAEAKATLEAQEALYEADRAAYTAAFAAAAARHAEGLGLMVGVVVVPETGDAVNGMYADDLAVSIREWARANAPLPQTGEPHDQAASGRSVVDMLRAAGLTYSARAAQS